MKAVAILLFSLWLSACVTDPPIGSLAAIKQEAYKEQYQVEWVACMKAWSQMEHDRLGAGRNTVYGPGGIDQMSYCTGLAKHKAGMIYR